MLIFQFSSVVFPVTQRPAAIRQVRYLVLGGLLYLFGQEFRNSAVDGMTIVRNEIGNMLNDGEWTVTWQNGR